MKAGTPWDYLAAGTNKERRAEAEIMSGVPSLYTVFTGVSNRKPCIRGREDTQEY